MTGTPPAPWPAVPVPPDEGELPATAVVAVEEASQVGEARRTAAALAARLGFSENDVGRVALVATELATNLARHAAGGVLVVQPVLPLRGQGAGPHGAGPHGAGPAGAPGGRAGAGVELVAVDRGPGIRDVARASADGFSTAGTAGQGLGAIRRTADVFDVYSALARGADLFDPRPFDARPAGAAGGGGSVVVARCWADAADRQADRDADRAGGVLAGGVAVPLTGETVCGDAWAACRTPAGCRVLVADGLGHGRAAAEASRLAVRLFRADAARDAPTPPAALLEQLHAALRATRGAAVALAEVRAAEREVRFAGVGNVAASVTAADGKSRSLMSHNGTVGHQLRRVQEVRVPWPAGAVLVLHSDGVRTQWRLADTPGLARRHPTVIAAALWRDHARGRDDATVVALRDAFGDAPRDAFGDAPRDAGAAGGAL